MEGVSREIPVLIAGGGPVGLMLAAELGWRGIPNLLVERDPPEERLNFSRLLVISVRTMELLRQLGASDRVRNWGFPPDHPLDNVFLTSLTGYELGRFKMYSLGEAKDDPFSPEHQWHCPQVVFDPILQQVAASYPATEIRYRTSLVAIEQDEQRVIATVENADGTRERIAAQYLIGCDGFGGSTRKLAGIATHGTPFIDHSLNIEFRVDNMAQYHDKGTAGRYICMDAEGTWGTCMVVDGKGLWRILMYGDTESLTPSEVDRVIRRLMGRDFPFEVVSCVPWSRRALIADRFRQGRVFLAGDAAHVHPPNGGFGMNTGIGDAADLGWKLEAVVRGWAAPALLDSYESERIPVCERVIEEAMKELRRLKGTLDLTDIAAPTPAGDALRQRVRERLQGEFSGSRVWHRWGIHLGAIYEDSPIIAPDGTPRAADDTYDYTPTTRPGSRAPHLWLRPGVSILDLFGRNHVLLRFGADAPDAAALGAAALSRGLPLDVHTIDHAEAAQLYERKLVLVRPDGYVAWRGDTVPSALAIIDRIRGASAPNTPTKKGRHDMAENEKPFDQIMAGLLHKELYIAVTEPLGGPGLSEHLEAHIHGQIEMERKHILFGAGPLQDEGKDKPTRGMFIIRAKSFEEARKILDGDVFHKKGLRKYKLYRWNLNEGSISVTINYSDQTAKID